MSSAILDGKFRAKRSCMLLISFLGVFMLHNAQCAVFDDVKFWFNGASPENADGFFHAGDLLDSLHKANPAHPMNAGEIRELTQGDVRLVDEPVRMAYRGVTIPSQKVIFLDHGKQPLYDENNVITNYSYEFGGVSFPSLFPATNNFTVLTRFKLHEFMNTAGYAPVFYFGYKWASGYASCGLAFQMGTGSASHNNLRYYAGTQASVAPPSGYLMTNVWIDLAVSVKDGKSIVAYSTKANDLTVQTNTMNAISWENTLNNKSGDISIGGSKSPSARSTTGNIKNYGRISMSQFAVWQRVLSVEEIKEAFMAGYPDLWREGVRNGDADDVSAPLTEANPIYEKSFFIEEPIGNTAAGSMGRLNQGVRIACAAGSGTINVSINNKSVGNLNLAAGQTGSVFVPATVLVYGQNRISLVRASGSVSLDSVEFGGSWQVGYENDSYVEFSHNMDYVFGDGNWDSGFRALAGVGNSSNASNGWIRVNVPDILARNYHFAFDIRTRCIVPNRDITNRVPLRVSVNGIEKAIFDVPYVGSPWPVYTVNLNGNELTPGWNVIQLDHAGVLDLGTDDYLCIDCFRLRVTGKRNGLGIIIR